MCTDKIDAWSLGVLLFEVATMSVAVPGQDDMGVPARCKHFLQQRLPEARPQLQRKLGLRGREFLSLSRPADVLYPNSFPPLPQWRNHTLHMH